MSVIEINAEDYIPKPGDQVLSRTKRYLDGFLIENSLIIKRPGIPEGEFTYQPNPSGARDPESGERIWGYYPSNRSKSQETRSAGRTNPENF